MYLSWYGIGNVGQAVGRPHNSPYESNVLYFDAVKRDLDKAVFECRAHNEHGESPPALIEIDVLCKYPSNTHTLSIYHFDFYHF